jgi:hypothetical protein
MFRVCSESLWKLINKKREKKTEKEKKKAKKGK